MPPQRRRHLQMARSLCSSTPDATAAREIYRVPVGRDCGPRYHVKERKKEQGEKEGISHLNIVSLHFSREERLAGDSKCTRHTLAHSTTPFCSKVLTTESERRDTSCRPCGNDPTSTARQLAQGHCDSGNTHTTHTCEQRINTHTLS